MSTTDTCLKCGKPGHTSSSCPEKWVQCVECTGFRMTLRKALHKCERIVRSGWSPSPAYRRECKRFAQADAATVNKRREALRGMGSLAA